MQPFSRNQLHAAILAIGCTGITGCGVSVAGPTATTSVTPLVTDDLAGPCSYELLLQNGETPTKGLLVIFERGDSKDLYQDTQVRETALDLDFGMIFAHECDAKSYDDLQADASAGPARALTLAVHQFALDTGHAEFETNGLVLYGFSAAGVLTATMANTIPDRMMGAVEYASGSGKIDLDDVAVRPAAAKIPTLILANAQDEQAGTTRNYDYFLRGRATGTPPWGYAVQNGTGHCCNLSTRDLLLPWLKAVASQQPMLGPGTITAGSFAPSPAGGPPQVGQLAQFTCTPDGVVDEQGDIDCSFSKALLGSSASAATKQAWLPDVTTANAWLAWVTNTTTN